MGSVKYAKAIVLYVGDLKPDILHHVFTKASGRTLRDWSGYSAVDFSLYNLDTGAYVFQNRTSGATVDDATNGVLKYEWTAGDTDTKGHYLGIFRINWGGSDFQHVSALTVYIKDPTEEVS